jgi:putative transposase
MNYHSKNKRMPGISIYNGLKAYFEFYNNDRFHQSLEYKTPYETYNFKKVA